jgi:stearoyl-CoA desaturase (Delta-9 desaturase)
MTGKVHKHFIIIMSVVPPLGLAAGMVLLWNDLAGWTDLAMLAIFYLLTGLGVAVGYHRLFAHRSFKTKKPIRLGLAVLGTMAAQGPLIVWASHHRNHHSVADQEGDPHSPHLQAEDGLRGLLKGFWHAHMGWLFNKDLESKPMRFTPDLVREPEMRWISQHFLSIVAAGIVLPGLIAFAITREPLSLVTGMLWGGLARIFLVTHATYAINSLGHMFGPKRFRTNDESRNLGWLWLPSLGESYHNNHHSFPTSARFGHGRTEIDPSAAFIALLERLGLAWDVVRPSPERMRSRALDEAVGEELEAEPVVGGDEPNGRAAAARDREPVGARGDR